MNPADVALEHLVLTDSTDDQRLAVVEALVTRAQAGDVKAFAALVSRFEQKVLTTAWRFLRDRDDAMDAAQETFLRAHKYLGSYDGRDFGAWLYRITVNAARDVGRRRGPQPVAAEAESQETLSATGTAHRALADALNSLTEKERTAFVMRDLDGLSTEEVARILGVSAVTVRVHICMARKKIRSFVEVG